MYISIEGVRKGGKRTSINLSYSEEFKAVSNKLRASYKKNVEKANEIAIKSHKINSTARAFGEAARSVVYDSAYSYAFRQNLFVPATRSFFAHVQKNIFTFLSSNIEIDPFLKEFGNFYEMSKIWHRGSVSKVPDWDADISKLMELIVRGEYESVDDQDWIRDKHRKVNLANASSGQQESVPLLLALKTWPAFFKANSDRAGMMFIEEPEAHLFPTAQSDVMSAISLLSGRAGVGFFITTHSPYILSAINNLLIAYEEIVDKSRGVESDFLRINGPCSPINYDDVSAYTISNEGVLGSIKDDETRIIGESVLDAVSDHFQKVLNFLVE